MLSFRDWLTEMKVVENGNTYFILPTDVRKINQDDSRKVSRIEKNKIAEKYKIEEIIECLRYFFTEFQNGKKNFNIVPRDENIETLKHLNINFNNDFKSEVINKILIKLQPSHFRYVSIENDKVAYIFGINVFDNKFRSLNADKEFFKFKNTIYIKFQFIFKALDKEFKDLLTKDQQQKLNELKSRIDKANQNEVKELKIEYDYLRAKYFNYIQTDLKFRTPSDINDRITLIYPAVLTCNNISIHKDR